MIRITIFAIAILFSSVPVYAAAYTGLDFGIDADITIIGPYDYAPRPDTDECPYGRATIWKKSKHESEDFIDAVECIKYNQKENKWITWKIAPNRVNYKKWYYVKYDPRKVDVCNDEGRLIIKKEKHGKRRVMIYKAFDNLGDPVGCF